ncbi:peptidase domain-containing ABC transporter [Rhodococcus sp. M8-20]|uniref:peptidase domain-containing ABC transporter n=1 Tax=unclassified Rhodococcus (in: high G+C Gram-positive bacteria) TaxID=192944 RepID=UPI002ED61131
MTRRIRPLAQTGMSDCGAACLAMIFAYFGVPRGVADLVDELGVSRDGLTALALVRCARGHGLDVRAFGRSADAVAGGGAQLPAVVHWDGNHFVVVERCTERHVHIVDPARGRRRLTRAQFRDGYSGVSIEFGPGDPSVYPPPAPPASRRRTMPARFLHGHRALLASVVVASIALQAIGMTLPVVSAILVDRVLPSADRPLLYAVVGATVVACLAHGAVGVVRSRMLEALRRRADGELTGAAVAHLLALPYAYFARRGTSDVVQRVSSVGAIRELLTGPVVAAVLDGPLALTYLALLLWWAPMLGVTLMVLATVQIVLIVGTGRRVGQLGQEELRAHALAEGRLLETVNGIETVKASGCEAAAAAQWHALFTTALDAASRSGRLEGVVESLVAGLRVAAPAVLMIVGVVGVLDGRQTLGAMIAANGVALAALAPLGSVVSVLQRLQFAAAHLARLRDIVDSDVEQHGRSVRPAPALSGAISLRGVGFRYDPRSPWVVRDIDCDIPAGSTVALVGPSGSGKSTLARLLLGLYEPTEGRVLFDGHDAADLESRSLRAQFGVVTQNSALFTGTVAQNIAAGRAEASFPRIVEAAKLAHIHDAIVAMPMGYETMLRDGSGLSGGQCQRIALARAVLGAPRVLLLDEATSALDAATEASVVASLGGLRQTRIVIAHRLSTVRTADVILVLDDGRIVERGGHHELLSRDGRYAELVALQTR